MPSHISENIAGHMSQLEVYMSTHPGVNVGTCMALMAGTIQKVSIENIHTLTQLRESHDQLCEAHDQLRELRESRYKLEAKGVSQNEVIQQLAEKLEQSQEKIAQLETLEKVMRTRKLSFDFTLIEFKSKKENNVDWYSPPFYTHTHGYRMCISVDANGHEDAKGTHLSVFAYLMEGPFDDYLEWPFQGTITIQLLNQLKDVNHHTHTINFTNTTDPEVIGSVTSCGRAEKGLGNYAFLPHTELDLKSKDDCQYLKDDQLKFRVSS